MIGSSLIGPAAAEALLQSLLCNFKIIYKFNKTNSTTFSVLLILFSTITPVMVKKEICVLSSEKTFKCIICMFHPHSNG